MPHEDVPFSEQLVAAGEGAPSLEQKLELVRAIRGQSPELAARLDSYLLKTIDLRGRALRDAQAYQARAQAMLNAMTGPPWHPATVLVPPFTTPEGKKVVVLHDNTTTAVSLGNSVPTDLDIGDDVFLGAERNVVVSRSPVSLPRHTETATFLRREGQQIVISCRDEELTVDVHKDLRECELREGSKIAWDRRQWMALRKIADPQPFLLGEAPDVGPQNVGGHDRALRMLLSRVTGVLVWPDVAREYGLSGRQSILLTGAPGCGKTLMARVAAAQISQLTGKKCRFFVVRPAEWESCWVGATEHAIRAFHATLRQAGRDGGAIVFFDEVESFGRARGGLGSQHDDKAMAALLTELDGFTGREGVAIVSATNRKDLIDPALLQRISDVEIPVCRPDMQGARSIFSIHLPPSLPFSPNGSASADTRQQIIETAVGRFYSPNSATAELAQIKFRDGTVRVVHARELASGRTFEQICRSARQAAFLRQTETGERGIRVADMEEAVVASMESLATTLTMRSVRNYLTDLPTDLDVVAVEPIARKVRNPRRFMN